MFFIYESAAGASSFALPGYGTTRVDGREARAGMGAGTFAFDTSPASPKLSLSSTVSHYFMRVENCTKSASKISLRTKKDALIGGMASRQ